MKRTEEKHAEAVSLCIEQVTMEEIGSRLGVSRRTVLRWLADPELKALIAKQGRLLQERKQRDWRRMQNAVDQVCQQVRHQKIKASFLRGESL